MGTVFLACEESGASLLHRQALRGKKAGHTALTKGFTGRLARAIHNRLMEELNQDGTAILPYPLQRRLVRNLAIPAEAAGRSDLLPLWAGQSANLSTCTYVLAFLTSLVEQVSEIAGPIIQWSAARREKQILKLRRRKNVKYHRQSCSNHRSQQRHWRKHREASRGTRSKSCTRSAAFEPDRHGGSRDLGQRRQGHRICHRRDEARRSGSSHSKSRRQFRP